MTAVESLPGRAETVATSPLKSRELSSAAVLSIRDAAAAVASRATQRNKWPPCLRANQIKSPLRVWRRASVRAAGRVRARHGSGRIHARTPVSKIPLPEERGVLADEHGRQRSFVLLIQNTLPRPVCSCVCVDMQTRNRSDNKFMQTQPLHFGTAERGHSLAYPATANRM
ncbi:Hypothetical predicted protein [Olea europaea subsp. europaea]|uniref:Uncharacterized protein n=1 Tax=Olea europaea subsp. europaea TaxID=158383 RepID=A0A8S0TNK8_OLEEU|nr:Hypothetical predicted protein [Olea europaea subsp. europaea]